MLNSMFSKSVLTQWPQKLTALAYAYSERKKVISFLVSSVCVLSLLHVLQWRNYKICYLPKIAYDIDSMTSCGYSSSIAARLLFGINEYTPSAPIPHLWLRSLLQLNNSITTSVFIYISVALNSSENRKSIPKSSLPCLWPNNFYQYCFIMRISTGDLYHVYGIYNPLDRKTGRPSVMSWYIPHVLMFCHGGMLCLDSKQANAMHCGLLVV